MEDKKSEIINSMITLFEEIIKNDLSEKERKTLTECLKYYKITIHDYFNVIFSADDSIADIDSYYEQNKKVHRLSYSNMKSYGPEAHKLFNNNKANKKIDNNLNTIFYRINLILQEKLNIEYEDTDYFERILKLQNRTILMGQRFGVSGNIRENSIVSFRTFSPKSTNKFNFTKLRMELEKNCFISKQENSDSFDIIFNQKKISPKFSKVSWQGSLLELKYFIKLLFEKNILNEDPNRNYTIIDCFSNGDDEIEIEQLNSPSGSKKKYDLIEAIVNNSHITL